MRILQLNMLDSKGGAARVALDLLKAYREMGHEAWLAVHDKRSGEDGVITIPTRIPARGVQGLIQQWRSKFGMEDFDFPATCSIASLVPEPLDMIHAHNLHSGYFDLRALPVLSRRWPFGLTLHDMWMLTGHCAHSFDCDRWRVGCGKCPYMKVPNRIARDATDWNWRRKRRVYRRSRLYVTTPSVWLKKKAESSILADGAVMFECIPNGVDLTVFQPSDQSEARRELDLPLDEMVVLLAAVGVRSNVWKDFATLEAAIQGMAQHGAKKRIHVLAVGESASSKDFGSVFLEFAPHVSDTQTMVSYYQAADVYLHAARADNFPTTILEALACGTPVVATAVGGVPEQIRGLAGEFGVEGHACDLNKATGILVPPGDADALARAALYLLENPTLRSSLAQNAAKDANNRFDLKVQARSYLKWYERIREDHAKAQDR